MLRKLRKFSASQDSRASVRRFVRNAFAQTFSRICYVSLTCLRIDQRIRIAPCLDEGGGAGTGERQRGPRESLRIDWTGNLLAGCPGVQGVARRVGYAPAHGGPRQGLHYDPDEPGIRTGSTGGKRS